MTNEEVPSPEHEELHRAETDQSMDVIQNTMDDFLASAHVSTVYGEPIQKYDTLIIPTAEVVSVLGFGVAYGFGSGPIQHEGEADQECCGDSVGGEGGGGGGGGKILSRPVAIIVASPEGVRVEPVVDVTKIVLAALTAAGFMIAMVARMQNPRGISKKSIGEDF